MDKKVIKNILKFSSAILLILLVWWLFASHRLDWLQPAAIRDYIQKFGKWAGVVYVLAYVVDTITVVPPIGVLSLTAGVAFGKFWGAILLMTASLIGTSITFFISRFFGRAWVEKIIKGKFKNIDDQLEKKGFITVLFFRFIPLIPYEVLNYVCGLSKIRYRHYLLGTFLGQIHWVIISAYFGGSLGEIRKLGDLLSAKFIWAAVVLVLALLVPVAYIYLKKKEGADGR